MAVNYKGVCVTNVIKCNLTENGFNILRYFNPIKSRLVITTVIYLSIFITLAPSVNVTKLFFFITDTQDN